MGKKSYSSSDGKITQRSTTRTRSDGKKETTHSRPTGGGGWEITGRSVHDGGRTDHYRKGGGGLWEKTNKKDSGGCFISTACALGQNLPDDCHELQVLRAFRDRLTEDAGGQSAVEEYYRDAPKVVASIDASPDPKAIYGDLYQRLVRRCVDLIEQGKSGEAFDTYRRIFYELKQQYAT